jgi:hypothetical protein
VTVGRRIVEFGAEWLPLVVMWVLVADLPERAEHLPLAVFLVLEIVRALRARFRRAEKHDRELRESAELDEIALRARFRRRIWGEDVTVYRKRLLAHLGGDA